MDLKFRTFAWITSRVTQRFMNEPTTICIFNDKDYLAATTICIQAFLGSYQLGFSSESYHLFHCRQNRQGNISPDENDCLDRR